MEVIKRPHFDPSLPGLHIKRQPIIRGGGATRCVFCGSLLNRKEDICPTCGATQISPDAEMNGRVVKDAPVWKKRYKKLGVPKGGYEGS